MAMFTSDTDEITREYFNSVMISTKYLDCVIPSTKTEIFGKTFATPVTTAALSHLHSVCENGLTEFAIGAKKADALHMVGMCEEDELEDILDAYKDTVKIIKPHMDDEVIYKKIEHAVSKGAIAVGMDIDHAIGSGGDYDNVFGLPMRTKTTKQLEEYIKFAKVPFVVKGVLSASDAEKCIEAGAKAIVVSHHHGMMKSMTPPLLMLPEIVKAVDGQATVFVDCGFESGMDVFKALALGADAVCVGRALMEPLKKGSDGVSARINEITAELKTVMARTGAGNINEIDPSVLRFRNF